MEDSFGAAKRNVEEPKPSWKMFHSLGARILQQILTGNADIDGSPADIYGNIERTQIEQLHIVIAILHDKLTRVGPQAIPRFR